MKNTLLNLYEKDGTKKLISSLISIIVGLFVGAIVIVIVGLCKDTITGVGIWDGVRIIFGGILSTGRNSAGQLTWGFNSTSLGNMLFRATPLIMTGLSVAVANKTGLFNIGAPGQYLMGTAATLIIALSIPSGTLPGLVVWLLAFFGALGSGNVAVPIDKELPANEVADMIRGADRPHQDNNTLVILEYKG